MPIVPNHASDSAVALAAEMRGAARRADARLAVAIDDYALPDDARLDDRLRARLTALITATIGAIDGDLRHYATKLIDGNSEGLPDPATVTERLGRAGVFRDVRLMDELLSIARFALLAEALPAGGEAGSASLLVRLADAPDRVVAQAARGVLIADSRDDGAAALPKPLYDRLVWWVAAAMGDDNEARDRALIEAALRSVAAHDEAERPAMLATRLALAVDARPEELAPLLLAALSDRRLMVFAAVLAQALKLGIADVRALLIDGESDRLWIALRAAALDREAIARIAWTLAEAEPGRDIEAFADRLDAIVAIPVADARAAVAPLALHPDYRAARAGIDRE